MKKTCHKCGRKVRETVHTQSSWIVDYFEHTKKDKVIVVCINCRKK